MVRPDTSEDKKERGAEVLTDRRLIRDNRWTESIAVGSEGFFMAVTKVKPGIRTTECQGFGAKDSFQFREPEVAYNCDFDPEIDALKPENTYV